MLLDDEEALLWVSKTKKPLPYVVMTNVMMRLKVSLKVDWLIVIVRV